MASLVKYCILFFLYVYAINCNGQVAVINGRTGADTTVAFSYIDSINNLIYRLQEKVELQNRELMVLKNSNKVDTMRYGHDSLIVSFISKNSRLLKTIKLRYTGSISSVTGPFTDLTITYFNNNGLLDYQEIWDGHGTVMNTSGRSKVEYRRHEYDDKNRLIRQVIFLPTPRMMDYKLTYDAHGNVTKTGQMIRFITFWGSAKETSKR